MKFRFVLLLLLICLVATTAQAQKMDIDWDKKVNFSSYKTYSWDKGTPAPNPLTGQRIIAGVDARLAVAGWQKVDSNSDVVVIYHASVSPQTSITTYSVGGPYNGYQWGWYSYGGGYMGGTIGEGAPTEKIQTIAEGQLVVDIVDVKSKNFIWRGSAKDTLKDRDPNKIKKKVENALAKMFKNFPPKPGQQRPM
jgi:hypothetical protein